MAMALERGGDETSLLNIGHRDEGASPALLLAAVRGQPPLRPLAVAVLGAGIAGLVAAYELSRLGVQVTVFEGGGRVGGRIWSYRFGDSNHFVELGAMRIPAGHRCVRHYVEELGLGEDVVPFRSLFHNPACAMRGLPRRAPELVREPVAQRARALAARLDAIVRATAPSDIYGLFRARVGPGLGAKLGAAFARRRGWAGSAELHPRALIDLLIDEESGLDPSVRLFLRDIAIEIADDLWCLRGGLQQLPNRLAERLPRPPLLEHEVVAIHSGPDCVELGTRVLGSAAIVRTRFDYVVCTIPPSAARRGVDDNFSPAKRRAIAGVEYASATKLGLLCRRRFWEEGYGIDGGASYLGGYSRALYFPSAAQTVTRPGDRRGAFIGLYNVGQDSDEIVDHDPERALARVVADVARCYPEVGEAGLIESVKIVHWQRESGFFGGCSVMWPSAYGGRSVEDLDTLFEALARPEGRVFFAGEHCSSFRAWIEGAVISSLRCVAGLLAVVRREPGSAPDQNGP